MRPFGRKLKNNSQKQSPILVDCFFIYSKRFNPNNESEILIFLSKYGIYRPDTEQSDKMVIRLFKKILLKVFC